MLKKICVPLIHLYKTVNASSVATPILSAPNRILIQSNSYFTTANMSSKIVSYDDVVAATKDNKTYIVDVREPKELQDTGVIPNSINIPLAEVENVFKNYSNEEFQKRFGRAKPEKNTELIFSCRLGSRAGKALDTVVQLGFNNAKNYEGSWSDWEKHL